MTVHITTEELERTILEECVPALEKLKFEPTYWRHLLIISMACTVVETAHTIVLLALNKKGNDANVLARRVLECMVEVKMLAKSEDYVGCMRLANESYWLKQLEEAVAGNPYNAKLAKMENIDEVIATHEKDIADLKGEGARKMTVLRKFEAVGLRNEYETVYRNLSGGIHGRLSDLMQRHITHVKDEVEVVAFVDTHIEAMQATLLGVRDWVVETTKVTQEFLEDDFPQSSQS